MTWDLTHDTGLTYRIIGLAKAFIVLWGQDCWKECINIVYVMNWRRRKFRSRIRCECRSITTAWRSNPAIAPTLSYVMK